MQLILASQSPRRRQLISSLGFPVSFADINADERIGSDVPIHLVAQTIAQQKAAGCPEGLLTEGGTLVTADTIVAIDNQKLGKPHDKKEAMDMLHRLSGRPHKVYTGVCLKQNGWQTAFTETTTVYFRHLEQAEIDYYIDTYKPFDKAGAYGIQEWIGMVGIERIDGDYYNVMGLPLCRLYAELKKMPNQ